MRDFLQGAVTITLLRSSTEEDHAQAGDSVGCGFGVVRRRRRRIREGNSDVIEVVLRPGCYLTHDVGIYKKAQNEIFARNPIAKKMGARAEAGAAAVGVCAVDSGAGSRDHRPRQARFRIRRRDAGAGAPLSAGDATRRAMSPPTTAGKSSA